MTTFTVLDRDAYIEQLQSIHGMRDQLGLSDAEYRDLLERLTGSRSARYMTTAQRERVIQVMRVHLSLDEALERLEQAQRALVDTRPPSGGLLEKVITLDGRREATMRASVEEIIETMRQLHGPEVRLTGARERRLGNATVLELAFESPAVLALAS